LFTPLAFETVDIDSIQLGDSSQRYQIVNSLPSLLYILLTFYKVISGCLQSWTYLCDKTVPTFLLTEAGMSRYLDWGICFPDISFEILN